VGKERLHHPARDAIELDGVLSALSDPIRRDILRKIASNGPQVCGDFDYDVAPSTMSYHCKVLRESGLVHTEAIGKHRQLTRRDEAIEALFPGLLESVGLPPGQGRWPEHTEHNEDAETQKRP
jgi:toxin-antitoxin system, antitoxin component, arsR family